MHVHHGPDVGIRQGHKDLTPLLEADIVLTTYEALRQEAPWKHLERWLLRVHWWRVVLDESQRVPKPTGAASSMTAIAKACADLSRTHSWCMSGTPVGSVVDDLLGQLIFLGVEPYCSRGDGGDAFWEREISGRWKSKDADALEVVHDLLGQIMMRHSKAQTMSGPGGQRTAIVALPEKVEEVVMVPLAGSSERAIYGELERMCRDDFLAGEAARAALTKAQAANRPRAEIERLRQETHQFRREDLLTPRELQHAACHVASLNLDATSGLEKKLSNRAARTAHLHPPRAAPSGDGMGGAVLLHELVESRYAGASTAAAAARLRLVLDDVSKQRCGMCASSFGVGAASSAGSSSADGGSANGGIVEARLTRCGHLFCTPCLQAAARQRGDSACPECQTADGGLPTSMILHTPLSARTLDETDQAKGHVAPTASLPQVAAAAWDTSKLPQPSQLAALRVWRCDGAPCHDGLRMQGGAAAAAANMAAAAPMLPVGRSGARARANEAAAAVQAAAHAAARAERMERTVTLDVDGMHFCSQMCAEAKFKRALGPFCSVCQAAGHQNTDIYVHDVTGVEKFRHPDKSGPINVQRDGLGRVKNGPRATGHCVVGDEWTGASLCGQIYASAAEAVAAFKDAVRTDPSYERGSMWDGELLYPKLADAADAASAASLCVRCDAANPHLTLFPPRAPQGAFLAHLDAAGASRSYGAHYPFALGSKVEAVLAEIARIRSGGKGNGNGKAPVHKRGGGGAASDEKVVVFSDSMRVLEVLHEAVRRTRGDGSVVSILGTTAFNERMEALSTFKERAACHVLLLSVGACASGLTLTVANHCLLVDLQAHEGKELQLVNRVWRIGQTKPVDIKRFVLQQTIEERMLHLRKRSRGLMASDDADTMAVSSVEEDLADPGGNAKAKGSAAAAAASEMQAERDEDLRYLYGVGAS